MTLELRGRFWHRRETVLRNAAAYLQQRIPELAEVTTNPHPYPDPDPAPPLHSNCTLAVRILPACPSAPR